MNGNYAKTYIPNDLYSVYFLLENGSLSNRTDRFTNEHRKRGGNSFSGVFLFVGNETIKQENSRTHIGEITEAICDSF